LFPFINNNHHSTLQHNIHIGILFTGPTLIICKFWVGFWGCTFFSYILAINIGNSSITWYIKYCINNPLASLVDTHTTLKREFNKPNSETQLVIGFKEIIMRPNKMPWELDQILKCEIHEANMNLMDSQHYKLFVVSLLPHLRVALSQQKIGTKAEALEIVMRLHEMPIRDATLGVQ